MLDAYSDAIRPGDTVLDIGAYVGPYSLLGSVRAGADGRVFAFEPDPVARGLLEANLTRNGVRNVEVIPDAVAATTGSLTLAGRLGSSTVRAIPQPGSGVRIRTRGLDEFCAQHAVSPAVIKIDVEGGESAIVSPGGERSLRDDRAAIVEMHPHLGVDADRIDRLFFGWGKPGPFSTASAMARTTSCTRPDRASRPSQVAGSTLPTGRRAKIDSVVPIEN